MLDVVTEEPRNAEASWESLRARLTPVEGFFQRNHYPIQHLSADTPLQVGDRSWTTEELRQLPQSSFEVTLECAGNARTQFSPLPKGTPWGTRAVSNGRWSGVPLLTLPGFEALARNACETVFIGADSGSDGRGAYARSMTWAEMEETRPLLALQLNGAPLTPDHGAPLRLLVPGYYGMASVKWLLRVEFWQQPFRGYYQVEDYLLGDGSQVKRMAAKAMAFRPAEQAEVRSPVTVEGWAWSGESPVVAVELEQNGQVLARVSLPAREATAPDFGWQPWKLDLPLSAGRHQLTVHAVCADGSRQPVQAEWNPQGYRNDSAQRLDLQVL